MARGRRSLLSKIIVGVSISILLVEGALLVPGAILYRRELVRARRDALALTARLLLYRHEADLAREGAAALFSLAHEPDFQATELAGTSVAIYDREGRRLALERQAAAPDPALDAAIAAVCPREEPVAIEREGRLFVFAPIAGPDGEPLGTMALVSPLDGITRKVVDHVLFALGLLLAILVALGLATILVVYFHVLRPIAAVRLANRAIVEGDDARALVPEPQVPQDELGDVIRARNELYRRMLEYEAAIREKNEILKRQAEELKRWARELEARVREKSHELTRAHERLVETEKLAATGRLAAGIAHEINNPLASIAGYAEDLLQLAKGGSLAESPEFEEFAESLTVIHEQAFRCKRIIRQLLSFARPAPFHLEPVEVGPLIADVLPLIEHRGRGKGVEVELEADPGAPPALADRANLVQVLVNLLENAFDAIPGPGGRVAISVEARGKRHVAIEIADTGCGIPEAHRSKVFDPFFTTKPPGSGTGLGLSIVHSIVSRHGGTIDFTSEAGKGTTFVVVLPAATAVPRLAAAVAEGGA
jgi:signal transduction histidine kinase